MGQPEYLIDTNAIIDYLGQRLPAPGMGLMNKVMDAGPKVSVITKIELLGYNAPDEHYRLLRELMEDASVLDLDDKIVDICISIRKTYKIKIPDAIIAATAVANNLVLITRNTADFRTIDNLQVVDPHSLSG